MRILIPDAAHPVILLLRSHRYAAYFLVALDEGLQALLLMWMMMVRVDAGEKGVGCGAPVEAPLV